MQIKNKVNRIAVAAMFATVGLVSSVVASPVSAQEVNTDGYLTDSRGAVVKSGTGLCVRTSSYGPQTWHPDCDPMPVVPVVAPAAPAFMSPPAIVATPVQTEQIRALNAEVLFEFDSDRLTAVARDTLDNLVAELTSQEGNRAQRIIIVGHTDPIGSNAYNDRLGARRAKAVERYLNQRSLNAPLSVNSRGENELKVSECGDKRTPKSISCNAPNRRVEVSVEFLGQAR